MYCILQIIQQLDNLTTDSRCSGSKTQKEKKKTKCEKEADSEKKTRRNLKRKIQIVKKYSARILVHPGLPGSNLLCDRAHVYMGTCKCNKTFDRDLFARLSICQSWMGNDIMGIFKLYSATVMRTVIFCKAGTDGWKLNATKSDSTQENLIFQLDHRHSQKTIGEYGNKKRIRANGLKT